MNIPPAFWRSLTRAEFTRVATTSRLDADLCAKLWRFQDLQGAPPREMMVLVRKEDVMRLWPKKATKP
jgi:hypothetical protein